MPDIAVQGYPLSRDARDSSALPFETIHIGDVRREAACRYVLLLWDFAGAALSCNEMRAAVTALVAKDPTFCGFEIVAHSADLVPASGGLPPPPTRSDLDSVVEAFREPYPVGISTASVRAAGLDELPLFPDLFIARKDDMRLVALVVGAGNTETRVRDAIAHPVPPPERLASGLDHPLALVADADAAYFYDATSGVVRVPHAGGAPTTLARPATAPTGLVADATYVYWATDAGAAGPSEVARVPKAGGAVEIVTSGVAGYTSIALDAGAVWVTRSDGVVASAPAGGGAEVPLATNEPSPTSVAIAGDVVWLADGVLVSMPKTGGARTVVLRHEDVEANERQFSPVQLPITLLDAVAHGGVVWARFGIGDPVTSQGVAMVRPGSAPSAFWSFLPNMRPVLAFTPDGTAYAGAGDGTGGFVQSLVPPGAAGPAAQPVLVFGQHDVTGLAFAGGDAYWLDASGSSAVLQRMPVP